MRGVKIAQGGLCQCSVLKVRVFIFRTEVQIYEKCLNITKDKIAKNYIILTVSSTQGPEALEYIWFSTLLDLYHGEK